MPRVLATPTSFRSIEWCRRYLSPLSSKPLVEQDKNFGDIDLNIFKIELLLSVFLHLQKIIKFQIELQE